MSEELLRVTSIVKRCGEVVAVRDASCAFVAGAIHAVCGENGAGKTTLLKVACGLMTPDAGSVVVAGRPLVPHTAREAIGRGVAMVMQHFALVGVLTALENVVLGAEPVVGLGVLDLASARRRVDAIARELGGPIDLDARVETMSLGERQRLEIVRALYRDARLVVLDEPTAVLTKPEVVKLYATLRRLADEGKGIVVVTHKMDEVRSYADTVTVMRRGAISFTRPIDRAGDVDAQVDEVTAAIMGGVHPVRSTAAPRADVRSEGRVVAKLKGVSVAPGLDGIDLELHEGEIVGLAGIEGNGQRELAALLAGDVRPDRGTIDAPSAATVRDDRQTVGLVLDATLADNLVLGELAAFDRGFGILDGRALASEAQKRLEHSGANGTLDRLARTLSGGNQQKIVVARALARAEGARVLVASHPTRGVDLGAARDIHDQIRAAAARGVAVLVISSDLDELRTLASHVKVLVRGRFVADLPVSATDEEIGRLMLGVDAEATS